MTTQESRFMSVTKKICVVTAGEVVPTSKQAFTTRPSLLPNQPNKTLLRANPTQLATTHNGEVHTQEAPKAYVEVIIDIL